MASIAPAIFLGITMFVLGLSVGLKGEIAYVRAFIKKEIAPLVYFERCEQAALDKANSESNSEYWRALAEGCALVRASKGETK